MQVNVRKIVDATQIDTAIQTGYVFSVYNTISGDIIYMSMFNQLTVNSESWGSANKWISYASDY